MSTSRKVVIAAVVLLFVVLGAAFVNADLRDRYRWLCELKGYHWVQPTHGEPYCGDGTGNPPDRNPTQQRREG